MPVRNYANAPATALTDSCSALATSIVVNSVSGLPISYPFTLIIDRGTASEEAVSVTAAAGTTLTVTRGIDGTTAFAHTKDAVVVHGITAQDIREANAHVNATSGVHGATGAVVGTTDAQVLTNKDLSSASNTLPTSTVTLTGAQTLTNKTLTLAGNSVQGAIKHTGAGNQLDATATAQTSQPAGLQMMTGRVSVTTGALGNVAVTFPGTGFPGGVLFVSAFTLSGTAVSPVVDSDSVTKTGMSLTWSGVGNTPIVFTYLAIGF